MRFLTLGVIGAAIWGIAKGMQNGTLKQFTKDISNKLNMQNAQQMMQPLQQMAQPFQQMNDSSHPIPQHNQQMNQSSK
ncbi:hypothetical protein [Lysinibacillus odysseyi]|uniref:hypothetical protein n=1 Tax=Lysinibacillus odysseyi TaxID=202611 RepID=UPI000569788F|nr:hypothetical protein [Lysinibacillus odysseyi]